MYKIQVCKILCLSVILIAAAPAMVFGAASVSFVAGTSAGWDFQQLTGDIVRNNTVDFNDMNILAQYWLASSCGDANQWCGKADIDGSTAVDLVDYAILAKNWGGQAGQNVLLQTIYGTAQDSAGNITASTVRTLQSFKGMAMAFAVPQDTALNTGIFKLTGLSAGKTVEVRLYNVSGKGYLTYNHGSVTRTDPGTGGVLLADVTLNVPSPAPYHSEGTSATKFSDMVINFGPMQVTAGEYLLVFDTIYSALTTGCNMVKGTGTTDPVNMGKYPGGTPLPKRATVTTSSAAGNTYYYYLNSSTDTTYSHASDLFACQITTVVINHPPVVNAGPDQIITYPANTVNLDGTVTDDGVPNPPGAVTTLWTMQSGPGTVVFGDANAVDTTVTFSDFGTYVLRLTASDGATSSYDDIEIGPCIASNPNPASGLTGVSRSTALIWSGCGGTVSHEVYFGTNSSDVSNGTTPTYTTSGNSYSPGLLQSLQPYYWRVDEFNGTTRSKGDVWSFTTAPAAQMPAFPGAEGAGKWTIGGRGGTVYEVTNLDDSGTGSLRAAVEASGPRIVVFRISGNITLHSKLIVTNPYLTIAGQTAPGDGICTQRYPLLVSTNNVIIRYIRCRTSDEAYNDPGFTAEGMDSLTADKGISMIFDHCSASWSVDEALSTSVPGAGSPMLDKVTVQWCIISEGLNCSVHTSPACHGYGTLAKSGFGSQFSYHHNLYAHNNSRNPYPGNYNDVSNDPAGHTFDFRNNVIYNWMNDYAGYNTQGQGANSLTKMNFVGNYYKEGLDSVGSYAFFERVLASRGYFSANWMNTGYPADPWNLLKWDPGWTSAQIAAFKQSSPFAVSDSITMDDALTAYSRVLADAGATLPRRDPVDTRIVNDVIDGTGHVIDDETDVGGWPVLNSTTPPVDSDHDGMPDSWEIAHGLDPNDANDGKLDRDGDGYTNVEEYLNSL